MVAVTLDWYDECCERNLGKPRSALSIAAAENENGPILPRIREKGGPPGAAAQGIGD